MLSSLRLKYSIGIILLSAILAVFAVRREPISPMTAVEGNWEYRWEGGGWSSIDYPSNPPGRDGNTVVWYRYKLPDIELSSPSLFVYSIDLNAVFSLDGEIIYRHVPEKDDGTIDFRVVVGNDYTPCYTSYWRTVQAPRSTPTP